MFTYADAVLGGTIKIPTIDGDVEQEIKPGTQPDTKIRLRGRGVPFLRNRSMRGDHYVTVSIKVPTRLNEEQREALKAFDDAMKGTSGPKRKKGLFG